MIAQPKLSEVFPLPEEAKRLKVFIGDWNAEGTLTFMGNSYKVKGYVRFSSAAAGWGVLAIGKMEIENLGSYEEVDILGFDRAEKKFHFFSVTNTAAAFDHIGSWLDDNSIGFHYEGIQNGKSYREELLAKFSSRELYVLEKDYLGEQLISSMDILLKK